MKNRKKYLIHKTQLKTTITLLIVIMVCSAVILGIVILNVSLNNYKLSGIIHDNMSMVQKIDGIMSIQDSIVEELLIYSGKIKDKKQELAIKEFSIDHLKNLTTINNKIATVKNNTMAITGIIKYNYLLLVIIIISVIIMGILFYIISIRKTHKILGPLGVMAQYMNDTLKGSETELRPIRDDDELKEFYDLFIKTVRHLKSNR